ncbi:MAG: murein transglycosylase A [Alphaproteobacteria bacterium]|nr:murein transglycosylase A [Alphaproteobacteria bacterium]
MLKTINGYWFQPKKMLKLFLSVVFILEISGCFKEYPVSDTKSTIVVKKENFNQLIGWNDDNFKEVIPVFAKNCRSIKNIKSEFIYSSQIKIKTADYQEICRKFNSKNINTSAQMKKFLEDEFYPYSVSDGNNPEGKFTSYYEAEIYASLKKTAEYKYPIYGKPSDLVEINLRDFDENLPNMRLVGRVNNGKFIPYYNRREIENKGIEAPVIMWGNDLVDIHFMQIQGSAIAHMADGTDLRIGYADNNGHKFRGIGSILISKKIIDGKDASMVKIRKWLRKNPDKAASLMAENERFIFQKLSNSDGPIGAMGISLTAGRSIAVDNQYIPLGAVMWLSTYNPDKKSINKIVFAQDIGGAIKGIVRGDYFWGHGEEALKEAGRMNSTGKYYILAPKKSDLKVN